MWRVMLVFVLSLTIRISQVEPSQPTTPVESKSMTEKERSEAIKRQVEYYFSRQNLLQVWKTSSFL